MKNLIPFGLACLFTLSGFLFDSGISKEFAIPYPFIFFSLGIASLFVVFVLNSYKYYINAPIVICVGLFCLILLMGTLSTLLNGGNDILAFGSKALTLFMSAWMILSGYSVEINSRQAKKFGNYFLLTTVSAGALVLVLKLPHGVINNNWVAITVLFSVLVFFILRDSGEIAFIVSLIAVSILSYIFLRARGISVICGFATLFALLFLSLRYVGFSSTKNLLVKKLAFFGIALSGIGASVFGVLLYNSKWYAYIYYASFSLTGKNIDSGRLLRWDTANELFNENPIFGWGIGAQISKLSKVLELGDTHNFWWEVAFRLGLVGVVLYSLLLLTVAAAISKNKNNKALFICFFSLISMSSVYALGGFTHWPGTFLFWFVIGLMLKRSTINSVLLPKYPKVSL